MNANDLMTGNDRAAFLLARIGDRLFALPAANVLEIVSEGTVTPLPFAPPWVCGLANIGGRILPLLDPAVLLGIDTPPGAELVLVATRHAPCALRTGTVLARLAVAADALRHLATDGGLVIAEFEHEGQPVLVLDPNGIGLLLATDEAVDGDAGLLGDLESRERHTDTADGDPYLAFRVAGARYAIALAEVGEVIVPPALTPVPGAPAAVAGIGMLRNDPLLFVSATALFDVPGHAAGAALVIGDDSLRAGLLVDAIDGVERIDPTRVRPLDIASGDFSAIAHDDSGRITTLTTGARLLSDERRRQLAPMAPAATRHDATDRRERLSFLEIAINGERFGIPLDDVIRIVDWSLPEAVDNDGDSNRISGAISVEGSIVPVLDPQLLQPRSAHQPRGAWVLVGDAGATWALGVDETRRIVRIPRDDIEEKSGRGDCLRGIAQVDRQLLSLVSIRHAGTGSAP